MATFEKFSELSPDYVIESPRKAESFVDSNDAGLRLDQWLSAKFAYFSRNEWQKKIRKKLVLVNRMPKIPSYILKNGDIVSYNIEFEEKKADLDFKVIFDCEEYAVIDKPANIVCHPAGSFFKNTLWFVIKERLGFEPYICNRLDRETSGIVIAAKNRNSASALSALFSSSEKSVIKSYIAIVHGSFPERIVAEGFLCQDEKSKVRKKRKFVLGKGAESNKPSSGTDQIEHCRTDFIRIAETFDGLSVVLAFPSTGRLHQIRATLYSLGFPMVGDKIYGIDDTIYLRFIEDKLTESDRKNLIFERQALHACGLVFKNPFTGKFSDYFSAPDGEIGEFLLQNKIDISPVLRNILQSEFEK